MDDLTLTAPARPAPTPQRPLLGLTVLVVEDSRFASEALRLLCLRSGARIRRADCVASAERHMGRYAPDVAIVDLGLPDGSGLALIGRMAAGPKPPAALLATSGLDRAEAERAAREAGAGGFLPKPIASIAAFQQAVLALLPAERRPLGLREVGAETVRPDPLAMVEDLGYAERLLDEGGVAPNFVAGFLQGVARTGGDAALLAQARALSGPGAGDELRERIRAVIRARRSERQVV
ncbi:response regulator [Jannaschia sp. W003]|uniref:response regulator n=1 Tax=Jannaschia sp. W003 TaxID=2867012 RepID=UPI0021A512B8|nr:response regulator [Jannaschia sp. W003]UWQ22650.1 response regulator [Jannaschia sp. W003]